jgi:iron complex outermembrane receptor protein
MSFMDDALKVNVGVRTPFVKREFTNFGQEGATYVPYEVSKKYKDVLPQLGARYRLTSDDQLFASVAKNVKAPPNFVFGNVGSTVKFVNGVATIVGDVKEETSWNTDIGYRHQDSKYIAAVTLFFVDFKDRQATSFDPVTLASTYTNVGRVKSNGLEIEVGNTPIYGWSFYGSLGYNKSEIKDNMMIAEGQYLPTAGKEMINAPKLKASISAEYQTGAFWSRLKVRATSKQQASMVNDEVAPGFTLLDLDGGYTFPNFAFLKRPKLQWNISNITNKQYRNAAFVTITNTNPVPGVTTTTGTQRYYLGAPRFASVTLSVDL